MAVVPAWPERLVPPRSLGRRDPRIVDLRVVARATVYPQRCALSPDGRVAVLRLARRPGRWSAGGTYTHRRSPLGRRLWWPGSTDGTWTYEAEFVDDRDLWERRAGRGHRRAAARPVGDAVGAAGQLRRRAAVRVDRGGRLDAVHAEARGTSGGHRPSPDPAATAAGRMVLTVTGAYAAFRAFDAETYGAPDYRLDGRPLPPSSGPTGHRGAGCSSRPRTAGCRCGRRPEPIQVTWKVDLSADRPDQHGLYTGPEWWVEGRGRTRRVHF